MNESKYGKTAWQIHEIVMKEFGFVQRYADDPVVQRVVPTTEQANEYVNCVDKLYCYTRRSYPIGMKPITPEEAKELYIKEKMFDEIALDMRDIIFEEDGKKGLRRVTGEVIVPPLFDDFPERYDLFFQKKLRFRAIPVLKNNKYALCMMDGHGTLVTDFVYDKVFMFFFGYGNYYVVERDGKKGLIDSSNFTVLPCEMDEIYEQKDTDGIIPYCKNNKWGLLHFEVSTGAIFDDILIESECYAQGKIGEEWYFIDGDGKPTKKEQEAWFGSWYDADK